MADRRVIFSILLLWLAGTALRLTILAVPPVIPVIHADLNLSATGVGILGGLPVVMFAFAALPGSLLIAKLGPVRALITGLLLTAIGGALRGIIPAAWWIYLMTMVTGAGVAVMQPTMAALVRLWLPGRIGFGTAVYTNGLLVGEVFPVLLMIPAILPLTGGSWPLGLAFWSIPVFVIAILVAALAPRQPPANPKHRRLWWPDWSDNLIWRLGLIFGSVNAIYFGTNTFLPDYLTSHGRADLISASLTALNLGQLPASFLLLALAGRLERHAWPYIGLGISAIVAIATCATTASLWTVTAAGALGFCCAGILVLSLALPPLLCTPADVARTSAAMMTISYAIAMVIAVVSGAIWDASGVPGLAFVPVGLCALFPILLAATIPFHRADSVARA